MLNYVETFKLIATYDAVHKMFTQISQCTDKILQWPLYVGIT